MVTQRILGLPDDIVRGRAPIAVGRFTETIHPKVDQLLGPDAPPATRVELFLDPSGIEPVRSARDAGVLLARRTHEHRFDWPLGARTDDLPEFTLHAALQATDGQWYVSPLRGTAHGLGTPNQKLLYYRVLGGDTQLQRTSPTLRLVASSNEGFPFRHGVDEVGMQRHFSAEGFLGDTYQPAVVDAHLARARAALDQVVDELGQVDPRRSLPLLRARVEGHDLRRMDTARASVHNSLAAAHSELRRLLPDEVGLTPLEPRLREEVGRLADAVEAARAAAGAVPHFQLRESVDMGLVRAGVADLADRVRALGNAPPLARGGPHAAASELAEFDALLARLLSGNYLTRGSAMAVFPYEKFGRTAAERMRNVGIAMETLESRVGFGDRGVHRLKSWLRDLADDAATVRAQLPPERRELGTLLKQVEGHARRNGRDGIVINARGVAGYEDFPDFAEVGAMGAALRTYVAIDDAGRLVAEQAPTPPPGDLLTW